MTLDPHRWANPQRYLAQDFHAALVEAQNEVDLLRAGLVAAKLTLAHDQDETRLAHWEESVASQDRAVAIECRLAHNTVEQSEADLAQAVDERDLLMFLIGHPHAPAN